ncbi:hypothetical protein CPB84DRAFT_1837361 [Gymnopilus junonius]|uniref:non-specific serine/threonine protein kinase n=1 Tax=Gymnopilus junonius TaxID=109634 RepID=A0A9P5TLT5_GYMJU|nr:hypothetical protein CPB84DRAFT_1837361 [Gymnopilus junonius]
MGNAQSSSALTRTTIALDSFVAELGADIILRKSALGAARFLKTVKCRHRNGYLVVKIFVKHDPGVSLRTYHRRLKMEKEALADIANVYNYQAFVETDKAGYIIRQWLASSLYDRISTRPFLSPIEKKWISFQLLNALRDARNRKIPHGDIKSSNVLVTSWNWIYLTDFASYKPTYLPLDDPSDFSFYFDMSGRRTCYLAPERFYTVQGNPEIGRRKERIRKGEEEGWDGEGGRRDGRVTEGMDVFSAGCVLAELFLEGAPLFTLSQLFKYREGEYKVEGHLAAIEDEGVQNLIKQMIALDPAERPTFDTLLYTSRGTVFPESFYSFLHNYVSSVNELSSEGMGMGFNSFNFNNFNFNFSQGPGVPSVSGTTRTSASGGTVTATTTTATATAAVGAGGLAGEHGKMDVNANALPSDSDHRMERIWSDYESIEPYIVPESEFEVEAGAGAGAEGDVRVDYVALYSLHSASKPFQDILPVELHIPNRESSLLGSVGKRKTAALEDGPALIVLALLTANIRNCFLPSSKLRALDVMLALSRHLTDEAKLDRMVPYIAAVVRSAAGRGLMQILMLVKVITPSNVSIFPEYIIPTSNTSCTYAQIMSQLADTSVRYLEMGQALKAHGAFKGGGGISYDASLLDLQSHIQEHLSTLLMDPSSIVKRAILHDIFSLCIFLGRQRTNDVLLSHMITYLNDRDWGLRYAFFESIVDVAACAGGRSLEEYILPLMVQALSDVEESVVAKVLAALTSLCELGLFQKMRIWELMSATLGFLYHPNVWIRQGAAAFITSAAQHLPPSDVWCILYPSLRHFLKSDIEYVDERSLLCAMKPPLPRQILDASVQWAMKAESSTFWRGARRVTNKVESPRESVIAMRKTGGNTISRNKSEEDETHIAKLQQLGMTPSDESKLLAMRDYTLKLANATSSFASRLSYETDAGKSLKVIGDIELQKLGVVPQTVFLKQRQGDAMATATSGRSSNLRIPSVASRRFGAGPGTTSSSGRTPLLSPSRQRFSMDSTAGTATTGGAPFEDLRRRLATINASASSLSVTNIPRDSRDPGPPTSRGIVPSSSSPIANSSVTSLALAPPSPSLGASPQLDRDRDRDRPGSPTDSVVSGTNSVSFRPTATFSGGGGGGSGGGGSRLLQVGNTTTDGQGQKAAPAVGSSKTNATGVLEAHFSFSRGSPDDSGTGTGGTGTGRTSPMWACGMKQPRGPSSLAISTYDGQEPGISNLLENLYLDNNRELQHDFGPKVHEGPVRRRNIARPSFTSRDAHNKRIEANLIANMTSHSDCITGIAVSPTTCFFVTSSDDKTVKVWDTARLERNVTSKPRHTYGQHHARVKSVCMLEGVHCFASAAEDGSVHVVRVVREHRVDNPGEYVLYMHLIQVNAASNLVYATTHSVITVLDLRTMRVLQTMENPRHYGPITSMCMDRKRAWIIVGTSTGVLTLWDKLGMLGVASGGKSVRIHQCVVHPSKGRGKWIMVALESSKRNLDRSSTQLVEVWDIEKMVLEVSGIDAETTPAAAIAALVRVRQNGGSGGDMSETLRQAAVEVPQSPAPDVRALVVGSDFGGYSTVHRSEFGEFETGSSARQGGRGFMITGSDDWKIRLWDLGKFERTTVLSGVENETEKPTYSTSTSPTGGATSFVETWPPMPASSSANRPPQRISLITQSQKNLLKNHQDIITALACIDSPFRGGIVSGDRAGVIKVWRVEQVDSGT